MSKRQHQRLVKRSVECYLGEMSTEVNDNPTNISHQDAIDSQMPAVYEPLSIASPQKSHETEFDNVGSESESDSHDVIDMISGSDIEIDSNVITSSDSECGTDTPINCIQIDLAAWALKHNISHMAVCDLLKILKTAVPNLPSDARTLLRTPNSTLCTKMCDGDYASFDLCEGIKRNLKFGLSSKFIHTTTLSLIINIDGLPLFKSSNKQFWPILCLVNEAKKRVPFPIGVYCGNKKPNNLNEFLEDCVSSILKMETSGIEIDNTQYNVVVHAFVCDAPARAFVKAIKGHMAYSSCERCTQEGEWLGRVIMPETKSMARTDETFRNTVDDNHHLSGVVSPLTRLKVDMVQDFPLDYMHLICLGNVRKLIMYWLKGPLKVRLGTVAVEKLNIELLKLKNHVPTEFNRKPRSLNEIDRWKATEFRQFVLYTGPVVLKSVLDVAVYEHFLLLHVAMSILLCDSLLLKFVNLAEELLNIFVTHYPVLYGEEGLVYNVHNLIHITDDARRFGALDSVSAFPFENFLGRMKKMLRTGNRPLPQLARRLHEIFQVDEVGLNVRCDAICTTNSVDSLSLTDGNKCCRLHCGSIVVCEDFILDCSQNRCFIKGRKFCHLENFYEYPCNSSDIFIYKVSKLSANIQEWPVSSVDVKCLLLPLHQGCEFLCLPLLHLVMT